MNRRLTSLFIRKGRSQGAYQEPPRRQRNTISFRLRLGLGGATSLGTWLAGRQALSQTVPQSVQNEATSSPLVWLDFSLNLPNNLILVWLFVLLLICLTLWQIVYRAAVEGQIRKGIHPRTFDATLFVILLGLFILNSYFMLPDTGLGVFVVAAVLFVVVVVLLFLSVKLILTWVVSFLFVAAVLVSLQMTEMFDLGRFS